MKRDKPGFDYETCVACHICETACPFSCITLNKTIEGKRYNKLYPELTDLDACTACGLCLKACPVDSIAMVAR